MPYFSRVDLLPGHTDTLVICFRIYLSRFEKIIENPEECEPIILPIIRVSYISDGMLTKSMINMCYYNSQRYRP